MKNKYIFLRFLLATAFVLISISTGAATYAGKITMKLGETRTVNLSSSWENIMTQYGTANAWYWTSGDTNKIRVQTKNRTSCTIYANAIGQTRLDYQGGYIVGWDADTYECYWDIEIEAPTGNDDTEDDTSIDTEFNDVPEESWLQSGNYTISWYNKNSTEFTLSTSQELAGFAYLINNSYTDFKGQIVKLASDIDLSGKSWQPIGMYDFHSPICFQGTFDGQNHTIKGINMGFSKDTNCIGLFECLQNATIKNLKLEGQINMKNPLATRFDIGGLAGRVSSCEFEQCHSYVSIKYDRNSQSKSAKYLIVGGLIGSADNSTIKYCSHDGDFRFLLGTQQNSENCMEISYIGGLLGTCSETKIEYSENHSSTIDIQCYGSRINWRENSDECNFAGIAQGDIDIMGCRNICDNICIRHYGNSQSANVGIRVYGIGTTAKIINSYNIISSIVSSSTKSNTKFCYQGIGGYVRISKANYSNSDVAIQTNLALETTDNGSESFSSSQMKAAAFLDEMNLYFLLNGNDPVWTADENGYPCIAQTHNMNAPEPETIVGDVNGDGNVNGTDLVALANMVLGKLTKTATADVNGDGNVNGTDLVALANIILGRTSSAKRRAAASASAHLSIEDFNINAGEEKEMVINLNNPNDELTLVQFDLHLPDGLSIKKAGNDLDIDMADRTNWRKHTLDANTHDGYTTFLLYSGSNTLIEGTEGGIIKVKLVADNSFKGGKIVLDNILLVSPEQKETKPSAYEYMVGKGEEPVSGNATLSIEDFSIAPDEEKEMFINLTNPNDELTLVQFDLHLPDGLNIKNTGNDLDIDMADRTNWRKHTLDANTHDGYTTFLLYSSSNTLIEGTEGCIIKVKLVANKYFEGGTIVLDNILFVSPEQKEIKQDTYEYKLSNIEPISYGKTFTAPTVEGIEMTFMVIGNKECSVCGGLSPFDHAIPTSTMGTVTIPSVANDCAVTSISRNAFYGCNEITTVVIPSSITFIEGGTFREAKNVQSIISLNEHPTTVSETAFTLYNSVTKQNEPINATLYVPQGTKALYEATVGWNVFKNIVEEENEPEPELAEGYYYLRNVGTGLLLSCGGPWGTHILGDNYGLDLHLVKASDGKHWNLLTDYSSRTGDGSEGGVGTNLYVDYTTNIDLTIKRLADGIYTVMADNGMLLNVDTSDSLAYFSGNSANDALAQWEFITIDDMWAQRWSDLEGATADSPVDATFLIKAAGMSHSSDRRLWRHWTLSTNTVYCKYGLGDRNSRPLVEVFRSAANNCYYGFAFEQIVTFRPGKYKLEVQGFYRDGDYSGAAQKHANGTEKLDAYLYVGNDDRTTLKSIFTDAKSSPQTGWSTYTSQGYIPDTFTEAGYTFLAGAYNNELTFTINGTDEVSVPLGVMADVSYNYNNWTAFCNFRLTYYGKKGSAIEDVVSDADDASASNGMMYDLSGRPISHPVKGQMYIQDGKKVLVK